MPRELKISIVASALSADPRVAAQMARQSGFDGLLFDAATSSIDLTDLSITGRREFLHVLSNENRQLVGLRASAGAKGFSPGADVDRVLHRLEKVMEAAAGLMAPLVTLDLGPLPRAPRPIVEKKSVDSQMAGFIIVPEVRQETAKPQADPPADPAFVSLVNEALLQLGAIADRFNVVVAMRSDLASFASLEQALQRAACPWFGVDLDPVAILRDDWSGDEVFSRVGHLIRHVRARDALVGDDRRTTPMPVGPGSSNWPELLAHLDSAGYHGWITIDPLELPDRIGGATRALTVLKQ